MAETSHLIRDKLIVGRELQGQEALQKGHNRSWPCIPIGITAGVGSKAGLAALEGGAQLVEPDAAPSEVAGGGERVKLFGVEVVERPTDKINWKTMDELFLLTPLTYSAVSSRRQPFPPLRVLSSGAVSCERRDIT